ncbi:MAG TPA: hypothetical protein VFQ55_08355 [Casimicrobiaceae bacterium]|nr:hypothetical protein [Casimicrobiaceae bacterium]
MPRLVLPALVLAVTLLAPVAHAANATQCTLTGLCYCSNADFGAAIAEKVAYYRTTIAAERAKGKAIGYLSVPLSTAGGAYFGINREVAKHTKERIEARFGPNAVWVLDPTAKEADLPTLNNVRASQGDYLVMWTRVLEGAGGVGDELDFVWFAGPSDFASYFGLTGKGDMERIAAFYEDRLAKDADFKRVVDSGRVTPQSFRNYYALRASASFSTGAHDEWNAIRAINQKRRDDPKLGITQQLPVFFDGRALSSAEFEREVGTGNAGACRN